MITRTWNVAAEETLEVHPWPANLGIDRSPGRPQLTSHRIVVVRNCAITGNHGANNGLAPRPPLHPGLILRALTTGKRSWAPSPGETISAIGVTADDAIITGSMAGDLDLWEWTGALPHRARQLETAREPEVDPTLTWAVYRPTSVVGICATVEDRVVAVTAGGMLTIWRRGSLPLSQPLGIPGTPRTIAASPDRLLVAVGIKQGNAARPDATVALVQIEPEDIEPWWRTPRILEIAQATDQQRQPNGTFDPAMLAVLADALEEVGAPRPTLDHLRRHDRRLTACWLIEGLRQ